MIGVRRRFPRRLTAVFVAFFGFCATPNAQEVLQPNVLSVFPLGGKPGSSFDVVFRGENLNGAYGIWFDCKALHARITHVEPIDLVETVGYEQSAKTTSRPGQLVHTSITVDDDAELGAHELRVFTPRGITGPLAILVQSERAVEETSAPKSTAPTAQKIPFPIVVNGRISHPGELDFFAFDVPKGQELRFEVLTGSCLFSTAPGTNLEPELTIYGTRRSWFDSTRPHRLKVNDESHYFHFGPEAFLPRVTHRFAKDGRYLASVGTLQGKGGGDYAYQLRIVPKRTSDSSGDWAPRDLAHANAKWHERSFRRTLSVDWGTTLRDRTGNTDGAPHVQSVAESESSDDRSQAATIAIPTLIEGAIATPGDTDRFRFHATSGESLVFEIETPDTPLPYFTPHLQVLDAQGKEVIHNLYRRVGGDGDDWVKSPKAKITFTFEHEGEYTLQLRDLTSRYGNRSFVYRVFVRRAIPHLGRVRIMLSYLSPFDHANVVQGRSTKLAVVTELEEGFDGDVALTIEGLPPGVEYHPGTASTDLREKIFRKVHSRGAVFRENFFPVSRISTVALVVADDAPISEEPVFARLKARAVVEGRAGPVIEAQTIPMMIIRDFRERRF